jgi:hypothetical protein
VATLVVLVLWYFTILALGAVGAFEALWNGTPIGQALALLVPLGLYFADLYWLKSRIFRGFWALDERTAVLVQTYRIVGAFFLVESVRGRLPPGFALPAAFGDVLVGLFAPWVAWRLGENKPHATAIAVAWNLLGVLDLVCAISLGILYAPTALGVLASDVTTTVVTQYPLCLIPAWVVPVSLLLHFRSLQGLLNGPPHARGRTVAALVGLAALALVVIAVGATVATVHREGGAPRTPDAQPEERSPTVNATRFEVERFDYAAPNRTFEQVTASFEQQVPAADLATFARLVEARAPAAEVERAVGAMVGDLGLIHLARVDQGPLVSLLGKRKRMTVYLLGNPVLANRMFEHHPEVGLYAPLRAAVYEDDRGLAHFTYDGPSTLLQPFNDPNVSAVARILDGRMLRLAQSVTGNVGIRANHGTR